MSLNFPSEQSGCETGETATVFRVGVLVNGKEVYAMYSTVIDGTTNKSDGVKGEIKAGGNIHQTKNTQEASTSSDPDKK
jgi:hypothetical protein